MTLCSPVSLWSSCENPLRKILCPAPLPLLELEETERKRDEVMPHSPLIKYDFSHRWAALFTVRSQKTRDALVSDRIYITATFPPPWPRNGGPGEPADRWRGRGAPADMGWPLKWMYQGEEDEMACGTLAFQLANSSHCQDECLC